MKKDNAVPGCKAGMKNGDLALFAAGLLDANQSDRLRDHLTKCKPCADCAIDLSITVALCAEAIGNVRR